MNGRPNPWISRVRISNYKSIPTCDVTLRPFTVLVGPNGAGKSNFLDALAFVADAVSTAPYDAVERRGGLGEILRRVPHPADSFSVTLDVTIPWGPSPEQWAVGEYGFEIGRSGQRGQRPTQVLREICVMRWQHVNRRYIVERGVVEDDRFADDRSIERDQLYLPLVSASSEFRALHSRLRGIRRYNLTTHDLRRPLPEIEQPVLGIHGSHLGEVLGTLTDEHPEVKQRLDSYLAAAIPGVIGLDRGYAGRYVTVELLQQTASGEVAFGSDAISDGTIRAAGVLASVFQPWVLNGLVSLVCVEEPETALYPDAAAVLFDALTEASQRVQIIATTQSPLLPERATAERGMVQVVTSERGLTTINAAGCAIPASREGAAVPVRSDKADL
ncbi:MAG: AAA family ATPase [Micromonosporaceae bacterium]|nr:AAA family ATPase [Micromonosporaceae bacterium]